MMKSQWFIRNILFSLMCNGRDYERKNMHLMKWDHFALCYNHLTDCNQWVGVEIKHSLSSHDDRLYLHERNEDAAEVAWCVWLNGFLQRLLVGCQVWEHDVWHVTGSQNNWVVLKACFVFFNTTLTILISSVHGMYFLIAPGDQDLNQSVFIRPSTLMRWRV